jgi:protein-disulfide isomerase
VSIREHLETAGTLLTAACAVLVTGIYVHAQISRPPDPSVPREQKAWREYAVSSMRIGPANAPVVITEFSDFQCPFCYSLYKSLDSLRRIHGDSIAIVYRNYPIDAIHPYARPAAIAAECAARAGQFPAFYSYLFDHQDSIRASRMAEFARVAGVRDTAEFNRCLHDRTITALLLKDSVAAAKLKISGTPMVLVNRWQFRGTPPIRRLDSLIRVELRQRDGGH